MSDEENMDSDTKIVAAEYKDGRLQIVEVTPYDGKTVKANVLVRDSTDQEMILPDMMSSPGVSQGQKLVQMIDNDKGLVHLDLLNLTLVKCDGDGTSYRLVANGDSDGSGPTSADSTVTCVLQTSDGEEFCPDTENQEYVMMEGDEGSLVLLQQALDEPNSPPTEKPKPTPHEILEKARALQKAKALMSQASIPRVGKRGRKGKNYLPTPHELLSSPNFKLFLYSCKNCSFKCNAVRELTKHKATEHGSGAGSGKFRMMLQRSAASSLQCARCPYRAATHPMLTKHALETHFTETATTTVASNKICLNTKEVEEADVLVCGACGFESASRPAFKSHIENEHGATTT